MKKRLLSLSALALTALSALAQATWTPPTPPAASELVPGEKVYLYNKEAGGFLRGLGDGNYSPYWGTRAGVAIEGADTIIIQKALEANIKENTTPSGSGIFQWDEEWDGQTYIIQAFSPKERRHGRWDEVWFGLTDLVTIWNDRQANVEGNMNFFWNVTKNDNGTYCFSASPKAIELADPDLYNALYEYDNEGNVTKEPAIKGGERIGVSISDANGELRFEGATEDLAFEWIVVSPADFAALDTATMKVQLATYRAAMSLKNYLEAKSEEFPEVDFTEVYNVYNNTSSTIEELQAAQAKVDALIVAWQAGAATPDNPKVLDAIQNATFDEIGKFDGWLGTGFGAGGTTSTCAENFNRTFNTYQDINVELPVGIYRVAVKGFHRAGGTDNDWNTKDDPASRAAKLYAVSGTDSLYTGIPALSQCASPSPVPGAGQEVSYSGVYLPNSMADFTVYKEAGLVPEVSVLIAVNNGKLRIGVVKTANIENDWTIVDDFTLEYYGSTLAAYQLYKEQILAGSPTPEDIAGEDALYKESYLTAYTEALTALQTAETAEAISAACVVINPALDALNANIKAYQNYKAAVEEAEAFLAENGDDLNPEADTVIYLTEYISGEYAPGEDYPFPNGAYLYIIGGEEPGACTLETEQVNEEIAYVHTLVQGAAKATMEGGDVTNLLVNPGLSSKEGWTLGAGCSPAFSWGVAEVYGDSHGHVDISQTITNVNPGIYSISVQAFERPAGNGSYDGTEEPKVFLYMGDLETPVQNITKDVLPAEMAVDRENCLLSNDYLYTSADGTISGYVPNGMEGASIAFAAGRYYQECYGIVGEDGIMKIGLTSHGVVPHWVLFDDFKLTYWGKNVEAMTEVLTGKYESGLEYLETYGSEMTTPAYNALNDALVAAEAAVDSEDFDQMSAALSAISKATIAAGENRTAVTELTSALDALDIAMTDYETSASEEALINAVAIMEKVGDDAFLALTTEEIKAITEEANIAVALLGYNALYQADLERVPTIPTDPAAYPFDMAGYLQNGDFSSGTDYWEMPVWGGGNNQALGNAREFWNGSAASLKFDLNQTLYALPHGKYTLEAELANAKNGAFVEANEGRAHLYADVIVIGEDTVTTSTVVEPRDADCSAGLDPYKIEFVVPEHKDGMKVVLGIRTVGTMAARWFAYDNFVLKLVEDPVTGIEGVETKVEVATPVAIYNISGTRVNKTSKGINIIKMSDGSVKKVLVK